MFHRQMSVLKGQVCDCSVEFTCTCCFKIFVSFLLKNIILLIVKFLGQPINFYGQTMNFLGIQLIFL